MDQYRDSKGNSESREGLLNQQSLNKVSQEKRSLTEPTKHFLSVGVVDNGMLLPPWSAITFEVQNVCHGKHIQAALPTDQIGLAPHQMYFIAYTIETKVEQGEGSVTAGILLNGVSEETSRSASSGHGFQSVAGSTIVDMKDKEGILQIEIMVIGDVRLMDANLTVMQVL